MNDTKNRSMLANGKTDIADDEVNDLLPQDTQSPQDVDDLLGSIGTRGLDVVEASRIRRILPWNGGLPRIPRKSNSI